MLGAKSSDQELTAAFRSRHHCFMPMGYLSRFAA